MGDQDIATAWKGFDESRRTALLAKMTPEQKKNLRKALEQPSASSMVPQTETQFEKENTPPAQTIGNFLRSAVEPIKGAVSGLYHSVTDGPRNPEEDKMGPLGYIPKRLIFDPSDEQNRQAKTAKTGAESVGHTVAAAIPFVGPWAADVAGQVGSKVGKRDYAGAAGTTTGNVALALAPKVSGKVVEAGSKAKPRVAEALRKSARSAILGPEMTRNLVDKTVEENTKIKNSNEKVEGDVKAQNLKASQEYQQQVRDNNEKFKNDQELARKANEKALRDYRSKQGKIIEKNRASEAATKSISDKNSNVQVQGSQIIYRLKQLDESLRAKAGEMYDKVRDKIGNAGQPRGEVMDAAATAEKMIVGKTETPAVIKDIMMKYGGPQSPELIPYPELQGYYSELGRELSKGTLPDDIYRATKALQNSIGDMMEKIADSKGAGEDLRAARQFYREYMDKFHEPTGPSSSGSPIAQALQAKDPAIAVKIFSGDAGDRGIAELAKYDRDLANLAQETSRTGRSKLPSPGARHSTSEVAAPTLTPVPDKPNTPLPPVLDTTEGKLTPTKKIGTEEYGKSAGEAAKARSSRIRNYALQRGLFVGALSIPAAVTTFILGHPQLAMEELAMGGVSTVSVYSMLNKISDLIEKPSTVEWLSKMPESDVAKIPPELRGTFFKPLVDAATRKGIKVSPTLVRALGTAGVAGAAAAPKKVADFLK